MTVLIILTDLFTNKNVPNKALQNDFFNGIYVMFSMGQRKWSIEKKEQLSHNILFAATDFWSKNDQKHYPTD